MYYAHFKQGESRPVTVVRPSLVKKVCGCLDAIQTYHVLAEDPDVDDIGIWEAKVSSTSLI